MAEYDFDQYEPHEHLWDNRSYHCTLCGITAEDVQRGRDKPATWDDVDNAYNDAFNLGREIGQAEYKHKRRRKLIEVGYYLALRRLGEQIRKVD